MNLYDAQTVAITGASSGIGAEFAAQLHQQGAQLILIARREERLRELCAKFNRVRRDSAEMLVSDLSEPGELKRAASHLSSQRIDILINNAGRGSFNFFEKLDLQSELQMVRTNIEAAMALSHAVIPQLKFRRSGGIIYVSSVAGFAPLPYMSTYAATKAFDLFHSLGLYGELRAFGVHVLAVCPGPTATEFGGVARVPGEVTNMARDDAQMVVRESLCAYRRRQAIVIPGVRSKLLWLGPRFLPLAWTSWYVERALRGSLGKS